MRAYSRIYYCVILTAWFIGAGCSKKIIPERPELAPTQSLPATIPASDISIPIQVNLKPFYQLAEKSIDAVFTSPGWPDEWVQEGCGVRYKYRFRRGPLQFKASGLNLSLGFTGNYQIIGSTRACVGTTVLSPWTPPCRCGFEEGERKVNVEFNNTLSILPDYKVRLQILPLDPKPVDRCNICFWGQDITASVMQSLKKELNLAKQEIEIAFGITDLKPYVSQLWNSLSQPLDLGAFGWLQLNPQEVRFNNVFARNDSLNIYLGLMAKPFISLNKLPPTHIPLPPPGDFKPASGFDIYLNAALNYDSLSSILTSQLANKQFDLEKGPLKKNFIIRQIELMGQDNERLVMRVHFEGSDDGILYLTGKPVYQEQRQTLLIEDLEFDVKTRDFLIRSANWLFNKKILNEIEKNARFDFGTFIAASMDNINQQMNQELVSGIYSSGKMKEIRLLSIYPLKENLVIRSRVSGNLMIRVSSIDFNL